MTKAIVAILLAGVAWAAPVMAATSEVLSPPYKVELIEVIDGDTFDVRITVVDPLTGVASTSQKVFRIRLVPADTAETRKARCPAELTVGKQGTAFTAAFLAPEKRLTIRCLIDDDGLCELDAFGRVLARTYADGADLGEALIAAGLAIPWPGHDPWCD